MMMPTQGGTNAMDFITKTMITRDFAGFVCVRSKNQKPGLSSALGGLKKNISRAQAHTRFGKFNLEMIYLDVDFIQTYFI